MRSEHYLFCCRIDDGDVIPTGAELRYWNATRGLPMDVAISYAKNPDVDGDNITDGKEINGYEVKIITGWKSDSTPISEMRHITPSELDPLIPYGYNSSDGLHWSDVDSDGIPDVVEAMLSNSSYFLAFYNFTHNEDWMYGYRLALWHEYSWTIAYYFSLKLHKNYDKIYSNIESNPEYYIKHYNSQPQHNASCGENATKYLTSQFNPFVVENMPPVIVKFNVNFTYYLLTAKMQVYAIVRDAGAIKKIELIDSDFWQSHTWKNINRKAYTIEYTFWASPWGANLGANITLIVEDMRGNNAGMSQVVYGPAGTLIKMFLDWISPFLRVLGEAWKAVQKAFNIFLGWVKDMIMNIINETIDTIASSLNGYYSPLIILITQAYNETNSTGRISSTTYNAIKSFFDSLNWIFYTMLAMVVGLDVLTYVIDGLTFGIGTLVTHIIIPIVMMVVVSEILNGGTYGEKKPEGFSLTLSWDYVIGFVRSWIGGGKLKFYTVRGETYNYMDTLFAMVSTLLGIGSWFSLVVLEYLLPNSFSDSWAIAGAALGALSWWVFGIAATVASMSHNTVAADILGLMAIIGGIMSLIISVIGALMKWTGGLGTTISLAFGILFSAGAVWMGIQSLSFV